MVNIKNFEGEKISKENFLEFLFSKQKNLMHKYKEIEIVGGKMLKEYLDENLVLPTINSLESQELCKNFAWRVSEEVAEGLDAVNQKDYIHLKEELADGLHFLTEIMIVNNFSVKDFDIDVINISMENVLEKNEYANGNDMYPYYVSKFQHMLGMSMNNLKIKPWKKSQTLVDEIKFKGRLKAAFYLYFDLIASFNFELKDIIDGYSSKNQVNEFRIKSNY